MLSYRKLSQSSSQDHLEHRVNLGLRDQRLHPHFRTVVWGHVPQLQVPLLNKQKSPPKYRLLPRPQFQTQRVMAGYILPSPQ
ncbi:hypothetical protein GBAR_LOCUS14098, partial [Geodia barretti]